MISSAVFQASNRGSSQTLQTLRSSDLEFELPGFKIDENFTFHASCLPGHVQFSGVIPERVPIVCMALGDRYPDLYVGKLLSMLSRHMPVPFDLYCVVDQPRQLPGEVKIIDGSRWEGMRREGMRITTYKLRLYDPSVMPVSEFLYLDTTLVIQRDMRPMLEFGFSNPADLVIVKDWNYDCYNTCVMRIRLTDALQQVYRDFKEGVVYPRRNPGDQDYLTASLRSHGFTDRVALWREGDVKSYRGARKLNRESHGKGYEHLKDATVVKFFGTPKMHELLHPFWNVVRVRMRNKPHGPHDAGFWVQELKELWK